MPNLEVPTVRWDAGLGEDESRTQLGHELEAWIANPALQTLAEAWNGHVPPHRSPLDMYRWFESFSADEWDFRGGRERNQTTATRLDPRQVTAAHAAARSLGLAEFKPPLHRHYDHVLVLGGLIRACLTRPKYVAALVAQGLTFENVTALGGFRTLEGDEIGVAAAMGLTVDDEFEAMVEGLRRAFAIPESSAPDLREARAGSRANGDWAVAQFRTAPPLEVIAAPSSEPLIRRANTADTFAWWASRQKDLRLSRILLVTTPIYVPYQGAAAIEYLGVPYHASVETVGISPEASDLGPYTQTFSAASYLQEIRSAIRGYHALYRKALSLQEGGGS
ncbi:hypothetical protein KIH31_15345 [Paenarthrobacter sp. DKR-5]|uniref:hypothetical protein n=1 Tax=Paenarthrobacter sp. DKR-5 TaxID=2835535 RepID=UPI001BDD8D72|nr:hypothetical protein [Paenarthrobacter sp. DKR-5]MBT1003964.1 hypothetical protein [Paenarthrobacter sp. DKR-5]